MLVQRRNTWFRHLAWGGLFSVATLLVLVAIYLWMQSPGLDVPYTSIALRAGRAPVPSAAGPRPGPGLAPADGPSTGFDRLSGGPAQQLAAENADIRQQLESLMNWVLANVRGKYPLPERMVTNLAVAAVNKDFTLSGDVAELLRVTPEERSMVDDALVTTRQNIAVIESDVMQVAESGPDKVKLYVPPYEEEGLAAREDLYAALEVTLGASRFDRFMDVANKSLEEQYNYFGRAARTMTFEVAYPSDQSIPPYLVIRDGWDIPDGQSSHTIQIKESSVYELPPAYLAYLNLMPANVASYARP